jgi:ERCC4-type nuclease
MENKTEIFVKFPDGIGLKFEIDLLNSEPDQVTAFIRNIKKKLMVERKREFIRWEGHGSLEKIKEEDIGMKEHIGRIRKLEGGG